MKRRKGFVANSSSTCFAVAFPHSPQSADEVKHLLFGDKQSYPSPFNLNCWPTTKVAETVWQDIKKPSSRDEIIEVIANGHFKKKPDFMDFIHEEDKTDIEIRLEKSGNPGKEVSKKKDVYDIEGYEQANNNQATEIADDFLSRNSNKVIYIFSYADDDGSYFSDLEHGGLFDALDHIAISYH